MADFERVGVIFVHGIGEQRRFEHLDLQARDILRAIEAIGKPGKPELAVSVEIRDTSSAGYCDEQNSWNMDQNRAPVRAAVRDYGGTLERHLFFHEVWWADVNEPISLNKQLRFWGWALGIWWLPSKEKSAREGFYREMIETEPLGLAERALMRLRLFGISFIFALSVFSIGTIIALFKRVTGYTPFQPLRIFVNYLSAVKLYNQKNRNGRDFLDALNDPPRVSIRRRMMRVLADAALAKYDRWYIVAHSLGTVVAFNGLMESGHSWPNYIDQDAFRQLMRHQMAGPAREPEEYGPTGDMSPARPLWLRYNDIVYRERVFERFRGFVTLGCPLNKFRTIWPARVPRNKFPAMDGDAVWLNIYDPTDPISDVLREFDCPARDPGNPPQVPSGLASAARRKFAPVNIGFRSHLALLYSHVRYLKFREKSADHGIAGLIARELVRANWECGVIDRVTAGMPSTYRPGSGRSARRRIFAYAEWIVLALAILALSSLLSLHASQLGPIILILLLGG